MQFMTTLSVTEQRVTFARLSLVTQVVLQVLNMRPGSGLQLLLFYGCQQELESVTWKGGAHINLD